MIKKRFIVSLAFVAAFVLWTGMLCLIDVRPIGPQGSAVGFAAMNQFVHGLTGVHMALYTVTDWLGLVPLAVCVGFGLLGLIQWIGRRSVCRVDLDLLVLGGYYVVVMAVFLLFESVVINYRPILIEGVLEASYPSSTTLLVMCVMPTAMMQLKDRIKNSLIRRILYAIIVGFVAFMVIGRLVSGVHWFSDIVGGALLSAGLVLMYSAFAGK